MVIFPLPCPSERDVRVTAPPYEVECFCNVGETHISADSTRDYHLSVSGAIPHITLQDCFCAILLLYPAHLRTRKPSGDMMRKLSVTLSQDRKSTRLNSSHTIA